jgi:TetR/AcrR family transcriptional regulator, transcriptional repressor for nem operon
VVRPRDFDLDAALDAAVELFWSQGFAATSVRQLCEAMDIRPGSFYAAFESKEECFRRALARYLQGQGIPSEPGPAAVRAWFDAILDPARRARGCLLVSSAVEHPLLDERSQALVSARMRGLQDFFRLCLEGRERAREDAALLAAAVIGVHVLARAGAPPAELRRIARRALQATGLG